jgi:hypothetical protein
MFPSGEIDALVCPVPLEGEAVHRNPLLVDVAFGACSDLQFGVVSIDAIRHIDKL